METAEQDDDLEAKEVESIDIYRLAALKCQEIYGTTKALHMGEIIECPKCSENQDIYSKGAANYSVEGIESPTCREIQDMYNNETAFDSIDDRETSICSEMQDMYSHRSANYSNDIEAPTCSIVSERIKGNYPVEEKGNKVISKCHDLFGQIRSSNTLQEITAYHCKALQENFDDKNVFNQIRSTSKHQEIDLKLDAIKRNAESGKKTIDKTDNANRKGSSQEPDNSNSNSQTDTDSNDEKSSCKNGNEVLIEFLNTVPNPNQDEEVTHTAEDIVRYVACKLKDLFCRKRAKTVYEQADMTCQEIHGYKEAIDKPKFQEIHRSMGNLNVVELAIPETKETKKTVPEKHNNKIIDKPHFQEIHRTLGQNLNVVEMRNSKAQEAAEDKQAEYFISKFQKIFGGTDEEDAIKKAVRKCQEIQKSTGENFTVEELLMAICRHTQNSEEGKNAADKVAQLVLSKCQEMFQSPTTEVKSLSQTLDSKTEIPAAETKTKAVEQTFDTKVEAPAAETKTKTVEQTVDTKVETSTAETKTKAVEQTVDTKVEIPSPNTKTKAVGRTVDIKVEIPPSETKTKAVGQTVDIKVEIPPAETKAKVVEETTDTNQGADECMKESYTIYEEAAIKCQEIYNSSKIPFTDEDTEKEMTGPKRGTNLLELPNSLKVKNEEDSLVKDAKINLDPGITTPSVDEKSEEASLISKTEAFLNKSLDNEKEKQTQEEKQINKNDKFLAEEFAEFIISICQDMFGNKKAGQVTNNESESSEVMRSLIKDIKKAEAEIKEVDSSALESKDEIHEARPTASEMPPNNESDQIKRRDLEEKERDKTDLKKQETLNAVNEIEQDPLLKQIATSNVKEGSQILNGNKTDKPIENLQKENEADVFTSKMQDIMLKMEKIDPKTDVNENCQNLLQLLADCILEITSLKSSVNANNNTDITQKTSKLSDKIIKDQSSLHKLNESMTENLNIDSSNSQKRERNYEISVTKNAASECKNPVTLEIHGRKPVVLQIQGSKIGNVKEMVCQEVPHKEEEQRTLTVYEEAMIKCQELLEKGPEDFEQHDSKFPHIEDETKKEENNKTTEQQEQQNKEKPNWKMENSKYLEIHGPLGDKLIVVEVAPSKKIEDGKSKENQTEDLKMMGIAAPISKEMQESEEQVHTAEEIAWYFITKCKEILGIPGEKDIVSDRCEQCPKLFHKDNFSISEARPFKCKHIEDIELRHSAEEIVQNIISKCQEIFGTKKKQGVNNESRENFQVVLGTFNENVNSQEIVNAIFGETSDEEGKHIAEEMAQNIILKCEEIINSDEEKQTSQEGNNKCYEADGSLKESLSVYEEAILKCQELYAKMDTTFSALVQNRSSFPEIQENLEYKKGSQERKDYLAGPKYEPQNLNLKMISSMLDTAHEAKETPVQKEYIEKPTQEEKHTAEEIARYFISKCKDILKKHDKRYDEDVKFQVICGPIEDKLTVEERAAKKCKELFGPEEKHTAEDIAQYFITKCREIITKIGEPCKEEKSKRFREDLERGKNYHSVIEEACSAPVPVNEFKSNIKDLRPELERYDPWKENLAHREMMFQTYQENLRNIKEQTESTRNEIELTNEQKTVYEKAALKCQEIYSNFRSIDSEESDLSQIQKADESFLGNNAIAGTLQKMKQQSSENFSKTCFLNEERMETSKSTELTGGNAEEKESIIQKSEKKQDSKQDFIKEKMAIIKINDEKNNLGRSFEESATQKCEEIQEIVREVKTIQDLANFFFLLYQEIISMEKIHLDKNVNVMIEQNEKVQVTPSQESLLSLNSRENIDIKETSNSKAKNTDVFVGKYVKIGEEQSKNLSNTDNIESRKCVTKQAPIPIWKEILDVDCSKEETISQSILELCDIPKLRQRKVIPNWQDILDDTKEGHAPEKLCQNLAEQKKAMTFKEQTVTPNEKEPKISPNRKDETNNSLKQSSTMENRKEAETSSQSLKHVLDQLTKNCCGQDMEVPKWREMFDNVNHCTVNEENCQKVQEKCTTSQQNRSVEPKAVPKWQNVIQNAESNLKETPKSDMQDCFKNDSQKKDSEEILIQKWLEIAFQKCQEILESSKENAKQNTPTPQIPNESTSLQKEMDPSFQKIDKTVTEKQSCSDKIIPTWSEILSRIEESRAAEKIAKRAMSKGEINNHPTIPTWQEILNNDYACSSTETVSQQRQDPCQNATPITKENDSVNKTKKVVEESIKARSSKTNRATPVWQEILNKIDEEEKESRKCRLSGIWKDILDDAECKENIAPSCFVTSENLRRNRMVKEIAQAFFSKFQEVLGNMRKTRKEDSSDKCPEKMSDTDVQNSREVEENPVNRTPDIHENMKQNFNELSKIRRNEIHCDVKLGKEATLNETSQDNLKIIDGTDSNIKVLDRDLKQHVEKITTGRTLEELDTSTLQIQSSGLAISEEQTLLDKLQENEIKFQAPCKVRPIHKTKNPEYTEMMQREVEREQFLSKNIQREREEEAVLREAGMFAVNEAPKTGTKLKKTTAKPDRKSEVAQCVRNEMVIRNMEIEEALMEVIACPRFEELIIGEIEREELRKEASSSSISTNKNTLKKTPEKHSESKKDQTSEKGNIIEEALKGILETPRLEEIIVREIEKEEQKKKEKEQTKDKQENKATDEFSCCKENSE